MSSSSEPKGASDALASVKRCLGLADLSVYIDEAWQELQRDTGPDWILLLLGQPLQSSTRRLWVRIKVGGSLDPFGPTVPGIVETSTAPQWRFLIGPDESRGPIEGMIVDTRELNPAECLSLVNLLEGAESSDLTHVKQDRIQDGSICQLIVFRRNPRLMTRAQFNSGAVTSEALKNQLCVKLRNMILSLRSRIQERSE
jgi:hypothetical protein